MTHDPTDSSPPTEPQELPWYAPGLSFHCTQCGNCCTGQPGFVWVTEAEIRAIAEYLDRSVGEIRLLHTRLARGRTSLTEFANGDCTFFDPKLRQCRIYPARPTQCRTWPFWRSNLSTPERWQETQNVCPGARCGEFVPLETIERLAGETAV
ncbi:MAG: YkgJ family cysteine cluster protein [Planctomycetaceae bacterium]|nr:YkgJ family cysteine cluster protein [Planctomycetaceae bacterium]